MAPGAAVSTTTAGALRGPRAVPSPSYRVNVVTFSVVREPEAPAKPTLDRPDAVAALARTLIPDDAREHFWILMLNSQNRLVAAHEVSVGTLSASLVHPREVFGPALRIMGVASLVLVHNHPSGDVTPSREDIRLTRDLMAAARLLDLSIHDHVILGNGGSGRASLAERGLLESER